MGTPGRVLDLLSQGRLRLHEIECFILDETDQMLDMGFQKDLDQILSVLKYHLKEANRKKGEVQYLLFSATIPRWVDNISQKFMKRDKVKVDLVKNKEVKTSKTV